MPPKRKVPPSPSPEPARASSPPAAKKARKDSPTKTPAPTKKRASSKVANNSDDDDEETSGLSSQKFTASEHIINLQNQAKLLQQQLTASERKFDNRERAKVEASHAREISKLERAHDKALQKQEKELRETFEKEWNTAQAELEAENTELKEEGAAVRKACEDIVREKEDEVVGLKRGLSVVKAQPRVWEGRCGRAVEELRGANERIVALEQEIDEGDEALHNVNTALVTKVDELAHVEANLMITKTQLASAHITITTLDERIADLKKKLEQSRKEMNRKLQKETSVKDRYFEDSQGYYNKSKRLEAEVKTAKEDVERLLKKLKYEKNRAKDLETELGIKREEGVAGEVGEAEVVVVRRGPEQMEDGTWT